DKKYSEEDILTCGKQHMGLKKKLCEKVDFKPEHAKNLVNGRCEVDCRSMSTKAMRKINTYIKEQKYSRACEYMGSEYKILTQGEGDYFDVLSKKYRHSNWETKEENEQRLLKDRLDLLPKNSLRNPVVEKILNQMINVVNALLDKNRKTD